MTACLCAGAFGFFDRTEFVIQTKGLSWEILFSETYCLKGGA